MDDLGIFSAAELRAGGINGRGFLQPLLAAPAGVEAANESRLAVTELANRGLVVRRNHQWQPIGRYARVLEAAAVARSLVAIESGPANGRPAGTPRLVLGLLGVTDEVLDLQPARGRIAARLVASGAAAQDLVGYLGLAQAPSDADKVATTADTSRGWAPVESLLGRGMVSVRVEAAALHRPEGPLLQHRLTVVTVEDGPWLLLGRREGNGSGRAAAPAGPARAMRVMLALLSGVAPEL